MNNSFTVEIWNPETGITDIDERLYRYRSPEIQGIRAVWADQQERLKDTTQIEEFIERVSREWAIETGIIENLYDIDRGITQTLIEQGFQADIPRFDSNGKPREFVLRLLRDQKEALDGVFDFVKDDRQLSTSYIKELHSVLLNSQHTTEALDSLGQTIDVDLIKGDWKKQSNFPTRNGTTYHYCPPEQVPGEMDNLIHLFQEQSENNVESEVIAAWLHHRFTQIHPFQDGNGRVARALASLVLIKDGLFPMVVHRDYRTNRDYRTKYINALEKADGNNLMPLIQIIIELQTVQFRKATYISESLLVEDDLSKVVAGLTSKASQILEERSEEFRKVFGLAKEIESDLQSRLRDVEDLIRAPLERISKFTNVYTNRSSEHNDYYYRSQIIKNAREYLDYYADTSEYRSWVSLVMKWSARHAHLVFTIHGLGKPFNGSLICSPFLEFRDKDDEVTQTTFLPVSEEGFVFFYTENDRELLARFQTWRENVLKIAIRELTINL